VVPQVGKQIDYNRQGYSGPVEEDESPLRYKGSKSIKLGADIQICMEVY
jgi:hypothetical protein